CLPGFDRFVTFTIAGIATRSGRSCRGRTCTCWIQRTFHGARGPLHPQATSMAASSGTCTYFELRDTLNYLLRGTGQATLDGLDVIREAHMLIVAEWKIVVVIDQVIAPQPATP